MIFVLYNLQQLICWCGGGWAEGVFAKLRWKKSPHIFMFRAFNTTFHNLVDGLARPSLMEFSINLTFLWALAALVVYVIHSLTNTLVENLIIHHQAVHAN